MAPLARPLGAPRKVRGMTDAAGSDRDEGLEFLDLREQLADRRGLSWRERFGGPDRYGALLLLIVATIIASVVLQDNEWERLVSIALIGVMLVFALRTSQASPAWQRAGWAVVPILVGATALAAARQSQASEIRVVVTLMMTAMLLAVLAAIGRRLSTHLTISWNTILGALCVYLLFGMVFASAYTVAGHAQGEHLFQQQRGFNTADTLYYSLITLTTVGYGDLTMRSDATRIMSAMEALLGQIYLITAIALLVGNFGRRRRPPRGSHPVP